MLPPRYKPSTHSVQAGGFGSVQKVSDTFLGRTVLFKVLHDKANNAQLLNELQALSQARSRHVVEIYDVISDPAGNVAGIIIELLDGREFSKFHLNYSKNAEGYLRVLYQIASALRDLHSCNPPVVHRDLKLDNIRESSSGIVKIFDFGISTVGSGYSTKDNRGTLIYAAPELYVRGATITPEMDIYAFGVCAWALASSKTPSVLKEMPPQSTGLAPSLDTVQPGLLSPDVIEILDKCLLPNPALRPSAAQVQVLLSRHLVRDKHRGLFVKDAAEIYELSNSKRSVRIKIGSYGELKVNYDGLTFRITEVTGDVFVNNNAATLNMELPEACVLTFGAPSLGGKRTWIPFSSSHPEVIL